MKRTLMIISSLIFIGLAEETQAEQSSLKVGISNEYLNKAGLLLYDGWISINDLNLVIYRDLYADVTTFTGLERRSTLGDFGDEIDWGVGLRHTYEWVKVDARLSYYMLSKLGRSDDDRWIFDLRVDFIKVPIVQPYFATRYFGSFDTKIPGPGWFGFVGIKRAQKLPFLPSFTKKPITLIGDAHAAYSDGALNRKPGLVYYRLGLIGEIPLGEQLTFTPSVTWQIPADDDLNRPVPYTRGKTEMKVEVAFRYDF